MVYSQSLFLRDRSNNWSNRNPPPRLTITTPPPSVVVSVARTGSSETGNVSPTIRRWQATFQVIRQDRRLLNEFLRRLQTRGDVFGRYFLLRFEDTFRQVVRQELHQVFTYLNLPPRLLPDQPARYSLRFINSVKSPTYTTEKVEPIQVVIYDSYTKKVSPDCPFSSAKVRFTVLNAEFWKNKGETWSRREFSDSILSDRVGKFPILTCGSRTFQLKDGVGASEEISFGDNSSWTKSGFRLGVMVEVEQEENGERVQEGVSESFRVLDRRGKASQKPKQLKLDHKVHNLKKIGKDRASRLEKYKINTVEDFLSLYYHDQSELREILGIKSETDKEWETMVKHAMECADEFHALKGTSQPQLVSMDTEVNNLNTNTSQFNSEYPISNNMNFASPQEADVHERTSHHLIISSELSVHTSGSNGLSFVGSGSSQPNPYENYSIDSGFRLSIGKECIFPWKWRAPCSWFKLIRVKL
ncbi:hypothetical protein LUZ62_065198 [Rhynchospora pubera]|uniref:Uncharacterized protein n=1 Tax=Rhynchospora pubera TaxID=906938 RepID=A0AAV8ERS2_9POAL|nr:hypothetical protein LUZ62_065198 [Rhynchospora pubera]